MAEIPQQIDQHQDWEQHEKTYRWFVRGTFLFAAHVFAVLLILGYVFSDSFG